MHPSPDPSQIRTADQDDQMRAQAYRLLAALLAAPPDADLLNRLAALSGDGSDWGRAIGALAESAATMSAPEVEREFNRLFIGVQTGELVPYASYYITGFLHDRPLVSLRGDMLRLGIARTGEMSEPEDHIAGLAEIMAGLIEGAFPGAAQEPAKSQEQARFQDRYLFSWAPRFFADLEAAPSARFYRAVGRCGALLMEIEQNAAALT
ncbi:molecular chaperone [Plastorhodobacter daqingensis]|uniref:Molecular chaperone n=1 Tax=Plastorhodobacter daqingensis TaxID=1387281 RepID=A0ABW2UN93_9RHOB